MGTDWTAEDINALLDPSSVMATTLADTQEREETSEQEQKTKVERKPIDARHVRRDGNVMRVTLGTAPERPAASTPCVLESLRPRVLTGS